MNTFYHIDHVWIEQHHEYASLLLQKITTAATSKGRNEGHFAEMRTFLAETMPLDDPEIQLQVGQLPKFVGAHLVDCSE